MLFHISKTRWDRLQAQSYMVMRVGDGIQAREGDNQYHVNEGESGTCTTCGQPYCSIAVNSPSELEMLKHHLGV